MARSGQQRSPRAEAPERSEQPQPRVLTPEREAARAEALRVRESVLATVADLARPVLAAVGVELDRMAWGRAGRHGVVQVFIDKPGGVTIDDCADVSRQLSEVLDAADVVPGAYTLEVSSPGLDRPLDGEQDFQRFTGRLACLKLRVPVGGEYTLIGRIHGVSDGRVRFECPAPVGVVDVPLADLASARLELEETDSATAATQGGIEER